MIYFKETSTLKAVYKCDNCGKEEILNVNNFSWMVVEGKLLCNECVNNEVLILDLLRNKQV